MELLFKRPFWKVMEMRQSTLAYCLMLHHCHWVLKLLEVSWQSLSKETQQFQQRNHKFSPHMLTISQACAFKYSKVKEQWQRTTIILEASISMVFHLHPEAYHKSKLRLKLMRMVSWMSQPQTREHQRMPRLPLLTIREDCQSKRLKNWLKMLRNTKIKMRK